MSDVGPPRASSTDGPTRSRKVVILGNGGHARACVDAWGPANLDPVGYVAPEPGDVLGLDHLGDDGALAGLLSRGIDCAFVALGDNGVRRAVTERCSAAGFELVTVLAPSAQVGRTARLGAGVVVLHGAIVGANARIGRGTIVNTGSSVDHDCVIGDFVHIAPGVRLAGTVTVGAGAMVGIGASVIQGITIGEGATVGAGAVVVRDVEPGTTVVSVAARELGS